MTRIPFFELRSQYDSIRPEIDVAIRSVFDDSVFTLGPRVEAFENAFAQYCGASHCVGLNSGTAALCLLMQAHGIGPGDEVITVANTFFSTAQAITELGATPVLVDCEEATALMDAAKLEAAITPRTKAIIPVHLYGQCADMDAINTMAKAHGLLVFEDACQAHGATYRGKKAGALCDGAAFSFYPTKNLGAYGEAGAVLTNDPAIAQVIRELRNNGAEKKYHHERVGWNERMDSLQGAILLAKLPHLDDWNARRRELAALYRAHLPASVRPMQELPNRESVYHLFVVRVDNRDAAQQAFATKGIDTSVHYPVPIHLQPAYAGRWKTGDFPVAETLSREILSLPLYPELTDEQVKEVCGGFPH